MILKTITQRRRYLNFFKNKFSAQKHILKLVLHESTMPINHRITHICAYTTNENEKNPQNRLGKRKFRNVLGLNEL